MRIAFYVSGKAGRVRKLLELDYENIFHSTVFVICDNLENKDIDSGLRSRNCNYIDLDYNSLAETNKERNNRLSDIILEKLIQYKIDYLFCFGEHILKGNLLTKYHNKIINFHPAILPLYPGLIAIDQAKNASAFLYGNTAHFIDTGIDTGPIIMQNIVHRDFFTKHGYDGILNQQIIMLEQIFNWLKDNRVEIIGGKVKVKNSQTLNSVFFPLIENV